MERIVEILVAILGGLLGWFIGVFKPAFPLIYVAIAFIVYDSWTAYELDKEEQENSTKEPVMVNTKDTSSIEHTISNIFFLLFVTLL